MSQSNLKSTISDDSAAVESNKVNTIHISKPLGHTTITAVLCGVVGGLLGIILDLLHRFDGIREGLLETYMAEPFLMSDPFTWSPVWGWVAAIVLATGVAYVVLDSVGKWRRVFIGLAVIILLISFSPLLMLWNVFWVPCVMLIAVLWAWLCAFFYTTQHVMPCELGISYRSKGGFQKLRDLTRRKPKSSNTSSSEEINPVDQQPDA